MFLFVVVVDVIREAAERTTGTQAGRLGNCCLSGATVFNTFEEETEAPPHLPVHTHIQRDRHNTLSVYTVYLSTLPPSPSLSLSRLISLRPFTNEK